MSHGPAKGAGKGYVEQPPRGYSWPPFEEGNLAAMKHGAQSERIVAPLAEQARSELMDAAPWLSSPTFAAAVNAWARAEARAALVDVYLAEHGPLDADGKPRPAATLSLQLERLAMSARSLLGLDPSSAARIQRDLAQGVRGTDLTEHLSEGRRLRMAAEARDA